MPMLTVKVTDEEMAALRALAAGRPMSDLVRDWIRGGQVVYTPPQTEGTLGLDTTGGHAVDGVDTSTSVAARGLQGPLTPILTGFPDGAVEFHDGRKPSFLAAPDDDCGACGHDRQMYHLGLEGRCTAAVGVKARCGCPAFVDPAEPF